MLALSNFPPAPSPDTHTAAPSRSHEAEVRYLDLGCTAQGNEVHIWVGDRLNQAAGILFLDWEASRQVTKDTVDQDEPPAGPNTEDEPTGFVSAPDDPNQSIVINWELNERDEFGKSVPPPQVQAGHLTTTSP